MDTHSMLWSGRDCHVLYLHCKERWCRLPPRAAKDTLLSLDRVIYVLWPRTWTSYQRKHELTARMWYVNYQSSKNGTTHGTLLLFTRMRAGSAANMMYTGHTLCKRSIYSVTTSLLIFASFGFYSRWRPRVFRVRRGQTRYFLKVARFGFELGRLAQEIQVYHMLTLRDSGLAPRLLGHAFEETSHHVIGFIFDNV